MKRPAAPKAPVLGWQSLWPPGPTSLPSVGDLPHRSYTTSGRAALLAALQQLNLPVGSTVLVPTYHCPTMVAPVLQAGLVPQYFPVSADGLPLLDGISAATAGQARVMFVAHYFGLPKGLQPVLQWCHANNIVLVEDCAHSYFGMAGDRPVGQWGDYATASLSKFFPVAEAGLLASATRQLRPLNLVSAGLRAQTKGALDVLEFAHRHRRLTGPSQLLSPLFWLKNGGRQAGSFGKSTEPDLMGAVVDAQEVMSSCDMARAQLAPSLVAQWLHRALPLGRMVHRRRAHYATLAQGLASATGARPLEQLPDGAAPYVCPVWVQGRERADAVYARMRQAQLPVFRWDRIWPGTPVDPQDTGWQWSRELLQLLCHQDLLDDQVATMLQTTRDLLRTS